MSCPNREARHLRGPGRARSIRRVNCTDIDEQRRAEMRARGWLWSSLLWLAFPIADALANHPPAGKLAGGIAAMLVFVAIYIGIGEGWIAGESAERAMLALGVAIVDVILATLLLDSSWASLFIFIVALGGMRLPTQKAGLILITCSALAVVTQIAAGASAGQWISISASTLGVGGLMLSLGQLTRANRQLREARADLARLAVAEERLRFGRDLHDLLGHSLSVIAVKAQLARRLLPERADEASEHLDDLETVARQALAEVREAVSGYRMPTLSGELAGARAALEAAGIAPEIAEPADAPPGLAQEAEALLAWAVREGTTNVIRHSGARRCTIAVARHADATSVEIVDDGSGCDGADPAGHGLEGLRERAQRLAGRLEAGAAPGGGFRLRVSVPVAAAEPVPA
jgi:two-component system, NarL family, sensor histidine kinase DesK